MALADAKTSENIIQTLRKTPKVAWPTVILLLTAYSIMGATSWACLTGHFPLWAGAVVNSICLYMLFTPAHESMHRNASANSRLNEWVMYVATFIVIPFGSGQLMRFMHMQHHRFTNQEDDPDHFLSSHFYLMPLWGLWPFLYLYQYARNPGKYPSISVRSQVREFTIGFGVIIALFVIEPIGMLYLWLIPIYCGFFLMCVVFMVLPHYPATVRADEDVYKATLIRQGWEWLLTPLLMYQNYHLLHHLYPTIPFYRYIKAWNGRLDFHLSKQPAVVSAFKIGGHASPGKP